MQVADRASTPRARAHGRATLRHAFARVLARPAVLWAIVAILAVRFVVDNALVTDRLDGISFVAAGQLLLHHPGSLYDAVAAVLHTGHLPVHGLMHPPAAAALAAPFSILPGPWDITAFTIAGACAALAGLLLLERALAPRGPSRPLFWIVALYFPPLYADVVASQFGGFLLGFSGAAIYLNCRHRPGVAGVLAGVAAAIKIYPAAIVTGAIRARGGYRLILGLVAAAAVLDLGLFIPLGQSPLHYLSAVLLPSLASPHPDCAMTGLDTLFGRSIGGMSYPVIGDAGLLTMRSPIALPWLSSLLAHATVLACICGALWAAVRSRGHLVYAPAIGLALGGIVPGELLPYQYLPLLPAVLIVLMDAVRNRRLLPAALIGVGLVGLVRQPCQLLFPNLWTLAGLLLFATCVAAAPHFAPPAARGAIQQDTHPGSASAIGS